MLNKKIIVIASVLVFVKRDWGKSNILNSKRFLLEKYFNLYVNIFWTAIFFAERLNSFFFFPDLQHEFASICFFWRTH